MGITLKIILLVIGILSLVGCVFWQLKEGGWEPKIAILGALSAVIVLIIDLKPKNYIISEQDNNARGILIPPEKFKDKIVNFDLGGGKVASYSYNTLKNGNPGQPNTHEGYKGIHVLTYDTPTINYGSILSFHISNENYLNVSAKFYNEEGDLVGAVKENQFISVRKNQISWNFDDKGLEVIDNDMHVNLLVDYAGGDSIKIRGILGHPEGYAILTDSEMRVIPRSHKSYKEILRTSKQQIKPTFEYFGNDWFGKRIK
jgi:hypothetical protein